ncbi:MAG: hypothetical protein LBH94_00045 [Deltaproteobacteria bacterium]|jgi:hypothetical protein|nr:hypothetical protein [Deltaproteobacteria bacterium]
MQARLRHDPKRGEGYCVIVLEGFEGRDEGVLFSLRRISDGKYLGSDGRLEAEQRLAPDMAQRQGAGLQLFVGPAVTDMMDAKAGFEIAVYPVNGESMRCALEIDDPTPSAQAGGQDANDPPARLAEAPEPKPEPQPAPQAEPEQVPEQQAETAPEPQPKPQPELRHEPASQPQAEPQPTPAPVPEPEPEQQPEPASALEPEPKLAAQAAATPEPESKPARQPSWQAEPEQAPEPQAETAPEPEPKLEAQAAATPEPESKPAPQAEPEQAPEPQVEPVPQPEPASLPPRVPEPLPPPRPAQLLPPPLPPRAPETMPPLWPAPKPAPDPHSPLPPLKDPVEAKSKTPLVPLLLLALTCVAGGVYWLQSESAPPVPRTGSTAPSAQGASATASPAQGAPIAAAPAASSAPSAPRVAAPATSSAQGTPSTAAAATSPHLQRAREHLRGGISPDEAINLAKSMQIPEGADGAFLLLEDAAQKGKSEAMLLLARFYDPTDVAPKGSIQPDPEQAYDWYKKARDGGQSAADDRLRSLRAWAEAEKNRNQHAKALLEIWK